MLKVLTLKFEIGFTTTGFAEYSILKEVQADNPSSSVAVNLKSVDVSDKSAGTNPVSVIISSSKSSQAWFTSKATS